MSTPADKRVGTTLRDKWVLEELLGVGGMASVYVGRHKIGRREAIKILHADVAASEPLRARFEQEALAVNAFKHPGVVEIRDIDVTEDGAPFLVMELLEGESLAQRSRREPRLTSKEVLEIAASVLDVLVAAHARGIIHRDIKPDNLFLTADGAVKVLDFGIARVRAPGRATTKAGVTLGTFAYMPPEQARGLGEIDGRADVYAVGATMFRLLANRIVHDVSTDGELVMRVLSESAPSLATAAPDVPAHVVSVVDRALAFERDDRYPDAATMKKDIDAVLAGSPPPYASSAAPIGVRAPSSLFEGKKAPAVASSPSQEAATFVPKAKREAPPSALPTRAGGVPEVAPTKVVPMAVPDAAARSERAPVSPPVSVRAVIAAPPVSGPPLSPPAGRSRFGGPPPSSPTAPVLTPFGELQAFVASAQTKPQTKWMVVAAVTVVVAVILATAIVALRFYQSGHEVPTDVGIKPIPTATEKDKKKK